MSKGFSFNNIHCSVYHLTMRSVDRTVLPPLRKRQLAVPGKHGLYDFEENRYDNRHVRVEVFLKANSLSQLRQRIRDIAGWLRQKGPLLFDDEPDKFYVARLYSQIPLEQLESNGIFPLTFECEPFAYSNINTTEVERTDETQIPIFNNGTVATPAEYTITNIGGSPVTRITVKLIQRR